MAMQVEEIVGFRRRGDLPGVEVRDVENSGRRWRCFATGYEFLAPRTWQGEILHRRRQQPVVPGMAFCVYPEEVFTTPRILAAGGGSAVTIDPDVFHGYLTEHEQTPGALDLRSFVRMSKPLSSRMRRLFHLLRPSTPSMELQSSLVDLVAALVDTPTTSGFASAAPSARWWRGCPRRMWQPPKASSTRAICRDISSSWSGSHRSHTREFCNNIQDRATAAR